MDLRKLQVFEIEAEISHLAGFHCMGPCPFLTGFYCIFTYKHSLQVVKFIKFSYLVLMGNMNNIFICLIIIII